MASFLEDLWNSIFTPGPTPTLLIATNATFAALQLLLSILLLATHSVHFIVLSLLSAGLWYSINWFARELQAEDEKNKEKKVESGGKRDRDRSPEQGSDTETEAAGAAPEEPVIQKAPPVQVKERERERDASTLLKPKGVDAEELRRRRSLGEGSGYVSTDSEWEKVSEGEDK